VLVYPLSHATGAEVAPARRVLLTVKVEDYFQAGVLGGLVEPGRWYRFETRLAQNAHRALDLLAQHQITATFFVTGWVAENMPELVRAIVDRGHEVGTQGYYHRNVRRLSPSEFREDVRRCREALERASGRQVLGHRVPAAIDPEQLWALDVLAEEGYVYDSSLRPVRRQFATQPWRRLVHLHPRGDRSLWEFPLSTLQVFGFSIPISGGNYYRQLPHTLLAPAVRLWHRRHSSPFVMYFHLWELDPEQPRLNTGFLTRLRHYRNLDKLAWVLPNYFRQYRLQSIADFLGMVPAPASAPQAAGERPLETAPTPIRPARTQRPTTIVVPCYNEEASLPYLANTLRALKQELSAEYDPRFVFVDDGSRDRTWEALNRLFGADSACRLRRHDRNRGVAAAILTGIRAADTEVVASIDCDCTYDPHQLSNMLPLLTDNVALVTASPYHPRGQVKNVPRWRLGLSRGASFLYRRVLRTPLHTYTSCFRVYRRSAVVNLDLKQDGFLGVAELLGQLDLAGARIVECPAVLESRIFGHSAMKAVRVALGHLRLLASLLRQRWTVGAAEPGARNGAHLASTRPEKPLS
jgi:polysaccharide deacetylase family protein (PEP-CTERM system associated)